MDLAQSLYQHQLRNDAHSLVPCPVTPLTMGLPPVQTQPQPNEEQLGVLTHINQRSRFDPEYPRRFLRNLLAMQGIDYFERYASALDRNLGQSSNSEARETPTQLQLSKDLTGEEKSHLPPFMGVGFDIVYSWVQNAGKCSSYSLKE